jgi:Cu(I)/Ag(I) efflux system membrane fusion protein
MGLPDTSPVPKKDPMGMDYVPVYEGEETQVSANGVKLSPDRVQMLGVRTEAAMLHEIARTVRAVGTIQVDERRLATVAPRFEGWIEKLHVNAVGQSIARGEPLMEIYSPELVAVQQEYLIAARALEASRASGSESRAAMQRLRDATLARLRYWNIEERDLAGVLKAGKPRPTLTLRAPVSGVVLDKPAVQGMRFMPGEMLYRIADLSRLWIIAEVFEQDLAPIRVGQAAKIAVNAYPGRAFEGRVAFIYPTLKAETRTARVRVELPNPEDLLKPDMYVSVELAAGEPRKVVAVPDSAVLDSGTRQVVLVERGEGRYEPRQVRIGTRADDHVEVLDGLREGEKVVVRANFLIDSESNLKAALSGLSSPPAQRPTHRAQAKIEAIDAAAGSVTLEHGPVETLKWPAMTMEFKLAEPAMAANLQPGADVAIEFEERGTGEFVVTRVTPAAAAPAAAQNEHQGR